MQYLNFSSGKCSSQALNFIFSPVFTFYSTMERFINTDLGLIHTRHFDAKYCDIAIKRYCDKKDKKTFFCLNIVVTFQNLVK